MITIVRLYLVCICLCCSQMLHASPKQTVRFGLTAVVVIENLRFLEQWRHYLEQTTDLKVEFVRRKSYQEIMSLLEAGSLDFAWICGYPFIQKRTPEFLQLVTVPVYRGKPRYHSYIIVHKDSPYKKFSDLKEKSFAYSDPDSNSGFLYPLYVISKQGKNPQSYFRTSFFTFNHAETIQAVAEQVADAGAVDSYIWDYLAIFRPELTKKTRIINKSQMFGFPPIVSRLSTNSHSVNLIKDALQNINHTIEGKKLLEQLKLDGFKQSSESIYNEIRFMAGIINKSALNISIP
jgi:phosphonate transport system substrate-binding protein